MISSIVKRIAPYLLVALAPFIFSYQFSHAQTPRSLSASPTSSPTPAPEACRDTIDNDGDSKIDYSYLGSTPDPGCASATDNDERDNPTTPQCSDGRDNDGDTRIDYTNDPGCHNDPNRNDERENTVPECINGLNDDPWEDTKIDFASVNPDPGCTSTTDESEASGTTSMLVAIAGTIYFETSSGGRQPISNIEVEEVDRNNPVEAIRTLAVSDQRGEYLSGKIFEQGSRRAFRAVSSASSESFFQSEVVEVTLALDPTRIDFTIRDDAINTLWGIATDRGGRRAAGVVVTAEKQNQDGSRERLRTQLTDDNGIYLMKGMPPGRYLVKAFASYDGEDSNQVVGQAGPVIFPSGSSGKIIRQDFRLGRQHRPRTATIRVRTVAAHNQQVISGIPVKLTSRATNRSTTKRSEAVFANLASGAYLAEATYTDQSGNQRVTAKEVYAQRNLDSRSTLFILELDKYPFQQVSELSDIDGDGNGDIEFWLCGPEAQRLQNSPKLQKIKQALADFKQRYPIITPISQIMVCDDKLDEGWYEPVKGSPCPIPLSQLPGNPPKDGERIKLSTLLLNQMSEQQLYSVIWHELYHMKDWRRGNCRDFYSDTGPFRPICERLLEQMRYQGNDSAKRQRKQKLLELLSEKHYPGEWSGAGHPDANCMELWASLGNIVQQHTTEFESRLNGSGFSDRLNGDIRRGRSFVLGN